MGGGEETGARAVEEFDDDDDEDQVEPTRNGGETKRKWRNKKIGALGS